MTNLTTRLNLLEQAAGAEVPLWIQRWLGDPLSDEDQTRAAAEWAEVQRPPPFEPSALPAHLRDWLNEQNGAATAQGEAR